MYLFESSIFSNLVADCYKLIKVEAQMLLKSSDIIFTIKTEWATDGYTDRSASWILDLVDEG